MKHSSPKTIALIALLAVLSAGCSQPVATTVEPPQFASTSTPISGSQGASSNSGSIQQPTLEPTATPTPQPQLVLRANVSQIDVLVGYGADQQAQAFVNVTGFLPDVCTEIADTVITTDQNRWFITLTTARPRDADCAAQEDAFSQQIPLEGARLAAGESYRVDVNGVRTTFEVDPPAPDAPPGIGEESGGPAIIEGPPGSGAANLRATPEPLYEEPPELDENPEGTPLAPIPGLAFVDSVEVTVIETEPRQILLTLRGTVPSTCTEVSQIVSTTSGNIVSVEVRTETPAITDGCLDVLDAFETQYIVSGTFVTGPYDLTINALETTVLVP